MLKQNSGRHDDHLSRGTLLNALAMGGGLLGTLWIPLASLLFGLDAMGGYFVLVPLLEIMTALLSSGASDAILIFGSRERSKTQSHAQGPSAGIPPLAFIASLSAAGLVTLALQCFTEPICRLLGSPQSTELVALLSLALVPACASQLLLALSKTNLRMEESALLSGAFRPLLLPACTLLTYPFVRGTEGLVLALVLFHWVFLACTLFVVARKVELVSALSGATTKNLRHVFHFVIPQTLNLTLNRYNARLDLLMLGHFGVDKVQIALYGTVLWVTTELRTIRLSVSSAMTPIAALLHQQRDRAGLIELLNKSSRWTTSLVGIALIVVASLLPEYLTLLATSHDMSHEVGDLRFAWVLLLAPFINCAWGLAGNILVAAQRQKWTLLNSAMTALLNTLLNMALIPSWGLLGAAIATVFATLSVSALQLLELTALERVGLKWSKVRQPYIALILTAFVVGIFNGLELSTSLFSRIGLAVGALVLYLTALRVLGLPELQTVRFEDLRRAIFSSRSRLPRSVPSGPEGTRRGEVPE